MLNYYSWWVVGGWVRKTKLMLYSTLVEIGVELGNKGTRHTERMVKLYLVLTNI